MIPSLFFISFIIALLSFAVQSRFKTDRIVSEAVREIKTEINMEMDGKEELDELDDQEFMEIGTVKLSTQSQTKMSFLPNLEFKHTPL